MELYRRVENYFKHSDARGYITGLLNTGTWREVNLITSEAGSIRGGHYHERTEECFLILTGHILVSFRKPIEYEQDVKETVLFKAGDVFIVNPLVEHTFEILENASWINLLSMPMDEKNPDFYRYSSDADIK